MCTEANCLSTKRFLLGLDKKKCVLFDPSGVPSNIASYNINILQMLNIMSLSLHYVVCDLIIINKTTLLYASWQKLVSVNRMMFNKRWFRLVGADPTHYYWNLITFQEDEA